MPPRKLAQWFYRNSNTVILENTRTTAVTGILNEATGQAEVLDRNNVVVAGGEAQPLVYQLNSQGKYIAQFPDTIEIPPGDYVKVRISLSKGGLHYRGILECKVVDDA